MEQKIFDISKLADSTYFADNRLPAHSDHHYYANEEEMLNEEMSMRQSLNGLWYFSYAKNLASRIEGFEKADYNCKIWDTIRVPSTLFKGRLRQTSNITNCSLSLGTVMKN